MMFKVILDYAGFHRESDFQDIEKALDYYKACVKVFYDAKVVLIYGEKEI